MTPRFLLPWLTLIVAGSLQCGCTPKAPAKAKVAVSAAWSDIGAESREHARHGRGHTATTERP